MNRKDAIIISPSWPVDTGGYGIAVKSALHLYTQVFDEITFIGVTESPPPAEMKLDNIAIKVHHVQIRRSPKWRRFAKSICFSDPAITMQFIPKNIIEQICQIITEKSLSEERFAIIIEDIPLGCQIDNLRAKFNSVPIAIRSHNVWVKAFDSLRYSNNRIIRLSWRWELRKIEKFERNLFNKADKVWAISGKDADEYEAKLGQKCHGIVGVAIDSRRYVSLGQGNINNIISIGTADLRKGHGIRKFINSSWIEVLKDYEDVRLVIAGKGTGKFADNALRIAGLGFVDNDLDVLDKGLIFINPQEWGSGIKLKSIIAMLSGKALVTTDTGIEGIGGIDGKHYLIAKDANSFAKHISQLLSHKEFAIEMGNCAREYVLLNYDMDALLESTIPLISGIARL